MPDEQKHVERASRIVRGYLRHNPLAGDQIPMLISTVHQALADLGKPAEPIATKLTPAVPIRRSIHRDYVVCLDCGRRGQMLRRHLRVEHNLSPTEYRTPWKLA